MKNFRQAMLIAICENNTQELYANLNQLRPENLSYQHLVLAGKLAKKFCWEGVFLFNAMLLNQFRCPQIIYDEIYKKCSSVWQRHLAPVICVQTYSQQEYEAIASNLLKMPVENRLTLLASVYRNESPVDNRLIWNLFLHTNIPATKENAVKILVGLLENYPFNLDYWYGFFVALVENPEKQFGKILLMHLLENPHLSKTHLASLPWGRWLEKSYIGEILNQDLYLRLQYLEINFAPSINHKPLQNQKHTKKFLRRLSIMGCNLRDPLLNEDLLEYFNQCYSLSDKAENLAYDLIQGLLKADYCHYFVTPPYSLEMETHYWRWELTKLDLLINNPCVDSKSLFILARPDRPITKKILEYLNEKSVRALCCVNKTVYQNLSPHLTQYPSQTAAITIFKMHLEWVSRVAELQEMQRRKGFKNPLIQFVLTPGLIFFCGMITSVVRLHEDIKNQFLALNLIIACLGALMATTLLTLVYRLIFTRPLSDYFPYPRQKYLSFSPDFTADFYVKLVQLEVLRIDLQELLATLQQQNPNRFKPHEECLAALSKLNLSNGRLTNCINSKGLFKKRWLHQVLDDLIDINPRLIRKKIITLHRDINQSDLRWGNELSRGSDVRQIVESYQPNFFQLNTKEDIETLETETTPLIKSQRSIQLK